MNTLIWQITESLINLFEMYIIYFFISLFFENKTNRRIINTGAVIIQAIILTLLNNLFDIASIQTMLIITILWVLWFCIIFGKENWFKYIYTVLLCDVLLIVTDFVLIFAFQLLLRISPAELGKQNIFRFIFIIFSKFITFYIIKNISFFKLNMGSIKKRLEILILSMVLIFNIVLSFFVIDLYKDAFFNNEKYFTKIMIVTLIISIANILILIMTKRFTKYIEQEMNDSLKLQYYKQQKDFIEEINQFILNIKQKQHDYKNHLFSIYALLSNNKFENAKTYISEQFEELRETTTYIRNNSSIMESIIYHKIARAKALNIEVTENINIPEKLSINEKDVTVLIGNAMDNAVESCEKVLDKPKYIIIKCYYSDGYFNVYIENSSDGIYIEKNNKIITTKPTKDEHGFGLGNIKYIVEKNHGFLHIQPEKDKFIMKCSILANDI